MWFSRGRDHPSAWTSNCNIEKTDFSLLSLTEEFCTDFSHFSFKLVLIHGSTTVFCGSIWKAAGCSKRAGRFRSCMTDHGHGDWIPGEGGRDGQ